MDRSDRRYLELLKLALIDALNPVTEKAVSQGDGTIEIEQLDSAGRLLRLQGEDWPVNGHTMIGFFRLTQLQAAIIEIVEQKIPGDLIECGVWRGGACIFMRACLDVLGDNRWVYAADSYQGLPEGDPERYPDDADDQHHTVDFLRASLDQVKAGFYRFGVETDRVQFVEGWFRDTLPKLAEQGAEGSWSLIRADGDMYESTNLVFEYLYPELSSGGFMVVDDYGVPGATAATDDYRAAARIDAPMQTIGESESVYWRKP